MYANTDNYTLECPLVHSGHLNGNTSLLTLWYQNNDTKFPSRSLPEPGPVESDSLCDKWALECIVKNEKNKRNGIVKYWVKWEGYGVNQHTMEPEEILPLKAVKDYWGQHAWPGNQQKKRRGRRNK